MQKTYLERKVILMNNEPIFHHYMIIWDTYCYAIYSNKPILKHVCEIMKDIQKETGECMELVIFDSIHQHWSDALEASEEEMGLEITYDRTTFVDNIFDEICGGWL